MTAAVPCLGRRSMCEAAMQRSCWRLCAGRCRLDSARNVYSPPSPCFDANTTLLAYKSSGFKKSTRRTRGFVAPHRSRADPCRARGHAQHWGHDNISPTGQPDFITCTRNVVRDAALWPHWQEPLEHQGLGTAGRGEAQKLSPVDSMATDAGPDHPRRGEPRLSPDQCLLWLVPRARMCTLGGGPGDVSLPALPGPGMRSRLPASPIATA